MKNWYETRSDLILNPNENNDDDDSEQSEDILLSMETFKVYGGCCIASDKMLRFKDISCPFSNCIIIWNKNLVPQLKACGTYNLPTTVI